MIVALIAAHYLLVVAIAVVLAAVVLPVFGRRK